MHKEAAMAGKKHVNSYYPKNAAPPCHAVLFLRGHSTQGKAALSGFVKYLVFYKKFIFLQKQHKLLQNKL